MVSFLLSQVPISRFQTSSISSSPVIISSHLVLLILFPLSIPLSNPLVPHRPPFQAFSVFVLLYSILDPRTSVYGVKRMDIYVTVKYAYLFLYIIHGVSNSSLSR